MGINTYILTSFLEGEAREVGRIFASIAKEIQTYGTPFKAPCVILSSGEATTQILDNRVIKGHGGPGQEETLSFALSSANIPGACLLSIDSEGTDGTANVAFQMPIYPMLDCEDTPSSAHNRAPVWNTRRNHLGWCLYLRGLDRNMPVPPYASPARAYMPPADPSGLAGMPPCYTYVGDAEPFLDETLAYVRALRAAGVPAVCDIYPGWYHAYDMMHPENPHSRQAAARLVAAFRAARNGCFVSRG